MATPENLPTAVRILDAAERLFAERGVANTSMRRITSAAGANVAAVNYHFGSRAALVEAVFARRMEPLNAERIRRLDIAAAKGADASELLRAFMSPLLEMLGRGEADERFIRLLSRTFTETTDAAPFFDRAVAPAWTRFVEAMAGALPDVPRQELQWRLHFLSGAVAHAIRGRNALGLITNEDTGDVDALSSRLLAFLAAGLKGPLPPLYGNEE